MKLFPRGYHHVVFIGKAKCSHTKKVFLGCRLLNTLWLVPRGTVNFVSREFQSFPRRSWGKHWDSRETKFTVSQGTSRLVICYIHQATFNWALWSRATAVNISRVTVNCFPFDVIVFAMLSAHGIWRETVSLLDVMWPWTSLWISAL